MFSRLKNFLYRNRRKFIIGSIIVGGSVLAINYVHKKILEWQENETKEFFKKAKKEQHYKNTERACNQTIFSLSKALKETIFRILDSDVILQKIREGDGSKVALWEELKIVVFAQLCSIVYGGLMLVLLLRIQLNIIAGFMVRCDKDSPEVLSTSTQEKYLSLCQHFLEKSIVDLCMMMKKHSEKVLKDLSLKQKLTLQDIENIFWRLEASVIEESNNPLKNLSTFLIPGNNSRCQDLDSELFSNVVTETVEILQHQDIISIAESSLNRAFSNTVDKVAEYYVPNNIVPHKENGRISEINEVAEDSNKLNVTSATMPLAKIVPILHGLYRNPLQNGCPDPWIEQFVLMEQLNTLGASIYEAYSLVERVR